MTHPAALVAITALFWNSHLADATAAGHHSAPCELLFRSDRGGGNDGLYRTGADGTDVRQLVGNDQDVLHFAIDPAGGRVAYVCDPNDTEMFELTVLELRTLEATPIHHGIRLAPVWSRDGARLAFMHHARGWWIQLTNPEVLIERPPQSHIGGDGAPSWFPGDARVVFQSNRTGKLELFTGDTTTGAATQLTYSDTSESSPVVSPDGEWIAYLAGNAIGVMRADGSEPRILTGAGGTATGHEWSPDSTRIAFAWERDENVDIYVIDVDAGAEAVRMTTDPAEDRSPSWEPNGSRIAFVSERDGDAEIYLIDAGGAGLTRVTRDPGRDRSPAWIPIKD